LSSRFIHFLIEILKVINNLLERKLTIQLLPDVHSSTVKHLDSTIIGIKQQGAVVILNAKHEVGVDCQAAIQINFQ